MKKKPKYQAKKSKEEKIYMKIWMILKYSNLTITIIR